MLLLTGCGGFVHNEPLVGPYALLATDSPEQLYVGRVLPSGAAVEVIPPQVDALGYDDHYVVAHVKEKGYFYVAVGAGNSVGPLDQAHYTEDKARLSLPEFRRKPGRL